MESSLAKQENIEIKDPRIEYLKGEYIKAHSDRVQQLSSEIGKELGLKRNDLFLLSRAAQYHDIGKTFVDAKILLKPSRLTLSEYELMKSHTDYGFMMLNSTANLKQIALYVKYHHENCDGTGYYGLKEDEIPYISKILRISDMYDALTSDRPYRKRYTDNEAISIMNDEVKKIDSNIFSVLKKIKKF